MKRKQKVVYILTQIDRIGEVAMEMFALRNLYPPDEFDITVITFPPDLMPRVNKTFFRIATRSVQLFHTTDEDVIWLCYHNRDKVSITQHNDYIYVFIPADKLWVEFTKKFQRTKPTFCFSLSESERARGEQVRRKFHIPDKAPVVTLHVRDEGYLPQLGYHSFRDSNIENYIPAIEYLIERGFYVVRIGDKSMTRLANCPPQLTEAPFHPEYSDIVEPYFISVSKFFICTQSGPIDIGKGFGTPSLVSNTPIATLDCYGENDLILPKKYYSQHKQRTLSYEEIVVSECVDFCHAEKFDRAGITLVENTPEEILKSVIEMNERIDGTYPCSGRMIEDNEKIRRIQGKVHAFRKMAEKEVPFFCMYWSNGQFSHEYLKANPEFLAYGQD